MLCEYQNDLKLCDEIGKELDERIRKRSRSRKQLAEQHGSLIDIGASTAYGHICQICNGYHTPRLSTNHDSRANKPGTKKLFFRLAALYTLLGFSENDRIVRLTKQLNPKFQYSVGDRRKSYTRASSDLELRCKVQVSFSDERSYLTHDQLNNLQRLCILYALSNKKEE